MTNKRIMIIQKSFPSYRKGVFDRLSQLYNFQLLHSNINDSLNHIESDYSKHIRKVKYGKKTTNIYLQVLPQIRRFKPHVIIHEFTPTILSIYLLFLFRPIFGYKIILWGHGFNRSEKLQKNTLKYFIRKFLIKRANSVLFYGNRNKDLIMKLWPSDKYFIAHNSLDTDVLENVYKTLETRGKDLIKSDLGINTKYSIVFVGRIIEEKIATESFALILKGIQRTLPDTSIIIIGDGPARNALEAKLNLYNIQNIKFLGTIHDNLISGRYLYISDIMLMPGYVGLAVNHALSYRLPIATFSEGIKGPYHSPEIEYVIHEKTGFLIDASEIEKMVKTITNYLKDTGQQEYMKMQINGILKTDCNIDRMIRGFMDSIQYVHSNEKK